MEEGIYMRNISALQRNSADLVAWIEKGARPEGVNLVQMEDGSEDLVVVSASGTQVSFYGAGSSVEKECLSIRGMDLERGSMTCLIGAGLGYTVGAILRLMERGHHVLLVEPDPWILKQALGRVDISGPLLDSSIHVLGPFQTKVEDVLVRLVSKGALYGTLKVVADPRSKAICNEYGFWVKNVQEAYQHARFLIDSSTTVQKVSIENEIENTLLVVLSPGVDTLQPLVRGKPVLIVGAGPSLDRSIESIVRARNSFYVFAFAAAWRNLLSHGIAPDFVLTSDKNVESMTMLRYTRFAQEAPIIFSSSALPAFVRSYTGPRFTALQSALYPLLPSHANHGVSLVTGSSVAVFALNLVIRLQADPILFIGLDLSIGAGEATHASGHSLKAAVDPNDHRLVEVEGVHGSTVRTLTHLQRIRRQIEHCISSSGITPINTTISGARIWGTIEKSLEEASAGLPVLTKEISPPPSLSAAEVRSKLPWDGVARLTEEIRQVRDIAAKGARSLALFKKGCRRGGANPKLASEINRSGKEIQDFLAEHPLLNQYFAGSWLALKQETQKTLYIQEPERRLFAEVDKNLRFLKELTEHAEGLLMRVKRIAKDLSRIDGKGESLEKAEWVRFLLDQGLYREAFQWTEGMGKECTLVKAEALAAKGLVSEALGRLENFKAEPQRRKAVAALLDRLAKEKEILLKEAEEVIGKRSWVDAVLLQREVERSFSGDPIVSQIRNRFSEKF